MYCKNQFLVLCFSSINNLTTVPKNNSYLLFSEEIIIDGMFAHKQANYELGLTSKLTSILSENQQTANYFRNVIKNKLSFEHHAHFLKQKWNKFIISILYHTRIFTIIIFLLFYYVTQIFTIKNLQTIHLPLVPYCDSGFAD